MKCYSRNPVSRQLAKWALRAAALAILPFGPAYGEGYIDEQNRLVIGGMIIEPPDSYVDANGNLVFEGQVFMVPDAELMPDGSLLLDGVIYPVPEFPVEGIASFDDWLLVAFPDPDDRGNPAISGPFADPGGHGVPNIARYALAVTDSATISDRLPRKIFDESGHGLSFPFIGLRDDVRIQVVAGSDLASWEEVLWDSSVDGPTAEPDSWVAVYDSQPLSFSGAARFLRLRISAVAEE